MFCKHVLKADAINLSYMSVYNNRKFRSNITSRFQIFSLNPSIELALDTGDTIFPGTHYETIQIKGEKCCASSHIVKEREF